MHNTIVLGPWGYAPVGMPLRVTYTSLTSEILLHTGPRSVWLMYTCIVASEWRDTPTVSPSYIVKIKITSVILIWDNIPGFYICEQQLGKDIPDYIIEVCLHPSMKCMYSDKKKFTDNKVTTKCTQFTSLENHHVYSILLKYCYTIEILSNLTVYTRVCVCIVTLCVSW